MSRIEVQVLREGEWRKLTSVRYEPGREDAGRPVDMIFPTRAGAIRQAYRFLIGWRGSHEFAGLPLRVAEQAGARQLSAGHAPIGVMDLGMGLAGEIGRQRYWP